MTTSGQISFVGGNSADERPDFQTYMQAIAKLEELRDLWTTATKHAPRNRHTAQWRERIKAEANRCKAIIAATEQRPAPPQ